MKIFKNLAVVFGISSSICAMDNLPYEVGHKILHHCIGAEPTAVQISSILPIRTVCTAWKNWFDGTPGIYFQGVTILPIDIKSSRLLRMLDHKSMSQLTNLSLQFYDEPAKESNMETFDQARIIIEKINLKCTQLQKVTLKGPFIIDVLVGEPKVVPNDGQFKTINPFITVCPDTMISFLKPVTQLIMGSCTAKARLAGDMLTEFWSNSICTLDNLKSIHIMDGSHNAISALNKRKSLTHIQIDKMNMSKVIGAGIMQTIETVPAGISFIASKNAENVWEITNPESLLNHDAEKEYFDLVIKNLNKKEEGKG